MSKRQIKFYKNPQTAPQPPVVVSVAVWPKFNNSGTMITAEGFVTVNDTNADGVNLWLKASEAQQLIDALVAALAALPDEEARAVAEYEKNRIAEEGK